MTTNGKCNNSHALARTGLSSILLSDRPQKKADCTLFYLVAAIIKPIMYNQLSLTYIVGYFATKPTLNIVQSAFSSSYTCIYDEGNDVYALFCACHCSCSSDCLLVLFHLC